MFTIRKFLPENAPAWDKFVASARNATFLHRRAYLEYHAERFIDSSLLLFNGEKLVAVLPATCQGSVLTSHGGLTYGGLLVGRDFHAVDALGAFETIVKWASSIGITRFVYKAVPHIYHVMPAEEDLYALFRIGATLYRRDLSSALLLGNVYPYSKGRKWAVNRAAKSTIEVRRSYDFDDFMEIERQHLLSKHGVMPVHSAYEMKLLSSRFPNNIRLYAAYLDEVMQAGMITYVTDRVCHAQYIAGTPEGKHIGAIDAVIHYVLSKECNGLSWFDFGISTVEQGRELDEDLVAHKETWGARAVAYDHYSIDI